MACPVTSQHVPMYGMVRKNLLIYQKWEIEVKLPMACTNRKQEINNLKWKVIYPYPFLALEKQIALFSQRLCEMAKWNREGNLRNGEEKGCVEVG